MIKTVWIQCPCCGRGRLKMQLKRTMVGERWFVVGGTCLNHGCRHKLNQGSYQAQLEYRAMSGVAS